MIQRFVVSSEGIVQAANSVRGYLAACRIRGKELTRAVLVVEEALGSLVSNSSCGSGEEEDFIEIKTRKFLGNITIELSAPGTEYALEHVYNVIDSRYRSGKPLILTANISPDVLNNPPDMAHARIYSRILEMCVPIHVTGVQNRKAAAQRKMDTLKSMMNEMVSND